MSSSSRARRILPVASDEEDLFVVGGGPAAALPATGPVATASGLLEAAERHVAVVLAQAEERARALLAAAEAELAEARQAGYAAGLLDGRQEALAEFESLLALVRAAAAEGKQIRDAIADQSAAVVARASALATRRLVGEYYEAEPERTAFACAEAVRAAAGQEILAVRVAPGLVAAVQAHLGEAASYLRPDEAVQVGGCLVDLRHGTLDATLDARLRLMETALGQAGGEPAA
ncbi:MAG: hypothetical protein IT304_07740 [Dehalococcoidia bacterium]|nr:hypothetical protein [Dehalococcoidia bacterium]